MPPKAYVLQSIVKQVSEETNVLEPIVEEIDDDRVEPGNDDRSVLAKYLREVLAAGLIPGTTLPGLSQVNTVTALFPLYLHLHTTLEKLADERVKEMEADSKLTQLRRYALFPRPKLTGTHMPGSKNDVLQKALGNLESSLTRVVEAPSEPLKEALNAVAEACKGRNALKNFSRLLVQLYVSLSSLALALLYSCPSLSLCLHLSHF